MRVSIAYDSVYGNTRRVAVAIAEAVQNEGHTAELINLRSEGAFSPEADVLFVGGPTHMGGATWRVNRYVRRLDRTYWNHRPVVVFDTYGPMPASEAEWETANRWINPGAAGRIEELARACGLHVFPKLLRCAVKSMNGPLADNALDVVKGFVHEFLNPKVTFPVPGQALAAAP